MIWSKESIDPSCGFDIQPDGTMKPRKIGCWVMTIEEAKEALIKQNKGD